MGLARPLLELNKALFPKIKTGFRNGTRHDSHTGRKSPAASNSKKREQKITDRRIHLKYSPHYRNNIGPKEAPAVRVYRSDSEGITLQIRREREFMSAWLPVADALAVAHAICEAAKEGGAQ
jgi:hypothetical protein